MRRIRWMQAEWPHTIATLTKKLRDLPFKATGVDGFFIDRARDNLAQGRYVEKIVTQETVIDPFGNEQVFDRIGYRQFAFNLRSAFPEIELIDAPRSTQPFISRLLEFTNFNLTVSSLEIDVELWSETIQKKLGDSFRINALQISNLMIHPGISARVILEGEHDVRAAMRSVIRGRKYTLDRAQFSAASAIGQTQVELFASGAARTNEEVFDEIVPVLRSSLPR